MLAYWSSSERCVFANQAYGDWFGCSPDALVGRSLEEVLGSLYVENLPHIRAVLAGEPQQFECQLTSYDGRVQYSIATCTPDVVDAVLVGFALQLTDITPARDRERALRRLPELLDRTGELAKVGGAELDLRTRDVFWSTEMCRILDVEPHRIPPAERWVDFFEPDVRPVYLAAAEEMNARGTPLDFEAPMITATGRRIWVRIRASSVIEDGVVVKLVAAHQDITERKQSEAALRESEERFRSMMDSSPVPCALNDQFGKILYLNPAFVGTLGWDLSAIPTLSDWWPLAYPDAAYREELARNWRDRLAEAESSGQPFAPIEVNVQAKDGSRRTMVCSATRLGQSFADVHLVTLFDITDRRLAERVLEETQARLNEALDQAHLAYWEIDPATGIFRFNDRFYALYGTTAEREGGTRWPRRRTSASSPCQRRAAASSQPGASSRLAMLTSRNWNTACGGGMV